MYVGSEHYEREWRHLFQVKDCTKVHNPNGTTCLYVSIPSDAIASVTFGVRCRPETEKIVRELKKRPHLKRSKEAPEIFAARTRTAHFNILHKVL
jgi:hypothetical protein